jgi:hypothetical protein
LPVQANSTSSLSTRTSLNPGVLAMDDYERQISREIRRRSHFRRLGFKDPKCAFCEEKRVICLRVDHLAGQKFGDHRWLICANCHELRTELQTMEHPPVGPNPDSQLERSRRVILNAADCAELLSRWLRDVGENGDWDG